ncbi:MAG TPA: leucyl aminopeptidase family protein [Candidatus Limnocylindrales bacterium]|nr:leucyl aminopeptidase family protein [Candidatus Limnocylindrales bacterium]
MTIAVKSTAKPSDRFDPIPSWRAAPVDVRVVSDIPAGATVVGIPVPSDGDVPERAGFDRATLDASDFTAGIGETLVLPQIDGPLVVESGLGPRAGLGGAAVRDSVAWFAQRAHRHADLVVDLRGLQGVDAGTLGQAATEGAVLARYRYRVFADRPADLPLASLTLVVDAGALNGVREGAARGLLLARATNLARDLCNAPATHLTATRFGDVAREIGPQVGLDVEVFDQRQLVEMGCGGILGVNAGSNEEARLIKLTYRPAGTPTGSLGLVGKGVMYDAGGISLKPSDAMHALMKLDMSGAAAIFGAMTTLRDLGGRATVTGFLCCTDNMPSGTATRLGDVLTIRGGKTVEVVNADAEGRLVMADGIALAVEDRVDAIVTIATLTGAALRTFGSAVAPVMGNDAALVSELRAAGDATDEPLWELPLIRKYRRQLDSKIADIKNMGGVDAGSITAGLFLEDFVAGTPFGHLDICGPMVVDKDDAWRPTGATAFGTRLLATFAAAFRPTRP